MEDSIFDEILKVKVNRSAHPWRNDYIARSESVLKGRIILHDGTIYDFNDNVEWDHHWTANDASSRLWLMSLNYVGELLSAFEETGKKEYATWAKKFLQSFIREYSADSPKLHLRNSSDHAHYVRTCVLIKAIQMFKEVDEEREFCREIVDSLIRHMTWMFEDKNHLMNNHGAMVDFGLILGSVQLTPLGDEASGWRLKGFKRLTALLNSTFDDDGMNNENTIGYHIFNISIYKLVMSFALENGLENEYEKAWDPILKKAAIALQHLIWQNGQIPPIGDSSIQESGYRSVNKSKFFKKANFAVIKDDSFYLSIKCGYTSMTHKHADETSITLRYKNKDILIDCGAYNYDRGDPYRVYMESVRSHCGIYPEFLDGKLVFPYREFLNSASIDYYEENDRNYYVRCSYGLKKDRIWVVRELYVNLNDYSIEIIDTYNSETATNFRQQFIFHPDTLILIKEDGLVRGVNGPVEFEISSDSSKSVDFYQGDKSLPIIRGWYSPVNLQKMSTTGVDYIETGTNGRFVTKIKLFDKD